MPKTIKFEVHNRWSNSVIFTANIECAESAPRSIKLGLAVKWAIKNGANLTGANLTGVDLTDVNLTGANLTGVDLTGVDLTDVNLTGANLTGVDLTGANLTGVNLTGVDLTDVNLTGANLTDVNLTGANLTCVNLTGVDLTCVNLRSFKACLWQTLTENPAEVPALLRAVIDGKIDGSQYEGECSCLVGTVAKHKSVDYRKLHHNASDPSERWFAMINEGDKPGDDTGGGFAAQKVVEWIEQWQSCQLEAK